MLFETFATNSRYSQPFPIVLSLLFPQRFCSRLQLFLPRPHRWIKAAVVSAAWVGVRTVLRAASSLSMQSHSPGQFSVKNGWTEFEPKSCFTGLASYLSQMFKLVFSAGRNTGNVQMTANLIFPGIFFNCLSTCLGAQRPTYMTGKINQVVPVASFQEKQNEPLRCPRI